MPTITTNKGNWTGESVEIEYNIENIGSGKETVHFELYGEKFEIRHRSDEMGQFAEVHGKSWDEPLAKGYRMATDGPWTFEAEQADVTREDDNPIKAAVQVLCNII